MTKSVILAFAVIIVVLCSIAVALSFVALNIHKKEMNEIQRLKRKLRKYEIKEYKDINK